MYSRCSFTKQIQINVLLLSFNFVYSNDNNDNPCYNEKIGSFIPNRKDCKKFYYCDQNRNAVDVYCPDGMWFNPEKEICDIPDHTICVTEPPPQITTTQEALEDVVCPERDKSQVVFIPSKIDCHRYYLCYHGIPMKRECIPELHWNEKRNMCDFPSNAKCQEKPEFPICPKIGSKLYPHPKECKYFIYCLNGLSFLQQCPYYHHYDVVSKSCKWKNKSRCFLNEDSSIRRHWLL